jgi:hypothetical protein
MIARLWHGWTTRDNADAYETLLRTKILPGSIASRDMKALTCCAGGWRRSRVRHFDPFSPPWMPYGPSPEVTTK